MTTKTLLKAPFPYFGGKSTIASLVWSALGDCGHYIEPFCGSCAVLLARPDYDPHKHTETVVDADGMIANVWRSLQADPDAVAKWCDWPVNHADLIARKARLNLSYHGLLEKLCAWSGSGGYARLSNDAEKNPNRHKETLFLSPHCQAGQRHLFQGNK